MLFIFVNVLFGIGLLLMIEEGTNVSALALMAIVNKLTKEKVIIGNKRTNTPEIVVNNYVDRY